MSKKTRIDCPARSFSKLGTMLAIVIGTILALLLVGCNQLPILVSPNVPSEAKVGRVWVSIEFDPKEFPPGPVYFRWDGPMEAAVKDRIKDGIELQCRLQGANGPRRICTGFASFGESGTYHWDFAYEYMLGNNPQTLMLPDRPGQIKITPVSGRPPRPPIVVVVGGGTDTFDPESRITLISPIEGATCVGTLSGNQSTVSFDWEDVPGTDNESGAYQIEVHRLSDNCQPVNWTRLGSGFDQFPRCWIADQNQSFHAENLDQNTQYRWRVRASQMQGDIAITSTAFSEFQTFTTAGPPTQPPTFVFPSEGQVIQLGSNTSSASIQAQWSQARCLPETFHLEIIPEGTDRPETTVDGIGHSASVPVRNNRQYKLRLLQGTGTGNAPLATVNFSTRP